MKLPQLGPKLGANLGKFLDFSLHQKSVIIVRFSYAALAASQRKRVVMFYFE